MLIPPAWQDSGTPSGNRFHRCARAAARRASMRYKVDLADLAQRA
jgi:hypothetical protein